MRKRKVVRKGRSDKVRKTMPHKDRKKEQKKNPVNDWAKDLAKDLVDAEEKEYDE